MDSYEYGCARYALQLCDTVKVAPEKGLCLTEGIKQTKDMLFFLNADSDSDLKPNGAKSKKPLPKPRDSPTKQHKVAGNKVLRSKTRTAAQAEERESMTAKLIAHQRDLHASRQRDGMAKYSEEGSGGGGKEGKTWKRFQSYKSEAVLPPDTETLRVETVIYS